MVFPKIHRQGKLAVVQHVYVVNHLIVEVVFGVQTERARLDAHIDVFRDQYDRAVFVLRLHGVHDTENLVVGFAHGQCFDQFGITAADQLGLEKQSAQLVGEADFIERVQRDALFQIVRAGSHQLIEHTRDRATIARGFGRAFFVRVEFFQSNQWNVNVVFLKAEQAARVVQHDVGIEYE